MQDMQPLQGWKDSRGSRNGEAALISDGGALPEVHCFVCSHVFADVKPVLLVVRDEGDWMFVCGGEHETSDEYHLVGMRHVLERDDTLCEVVRALPDGWEAERREFKGPWSTHPHGA